MLDGYTSFSWIVDSVVPQKATVKRKTKREFKGSLSQSNFQDGIVDPIFIFMKINHILGVSGKVLVAGGLQGQPL